MNRTWIALRLVSVASILLIWSFIGWTITATVGDAGTTARLVVAAVSQPAGADQMVTALRPALSAAMPGVDPAALNQVLHTFVADPETLSAIEAAVEDVHGDVVDGDGVATFRIPAGAVDVPIASAAAAAGLQAPGPIGELTATTDVPPQVVRVLDWSRRWPLPFLAGAALLVVAFVIAGERRRVLARLGRWLTLSAGLFFFGRWLINRFGDTGAVGTISAGVYSVVSERVSTVLWVALIVGVALSVGAAAWPVALRLWGRANRRGYAAFSR